MDGGRVGGAILFLAAGTNVMDIYSALMSSPWTAENFGADEEKAASCREYLAHSIGWTSFYCISAAIIAESWWPVAGLVMSNAYMYWIYQRALARGEEAASEGWASGD